MVGPCFVVHYLFSSFAIISLGKKDSWLLYFNNISMSFDSYCSVSLPRGDMGWSTVCVLAFPSHTHLVFHVICLVQFKNPHFKHHPHGSTVS